MSIGYVTYAVEQYDPLWPDPANQSAVELSIGLSYLGTREKAVHARLLADSNRMNAAHAEFDAALQGAPADARLWQRFVHFKAQASQYDSEMEHAMRRVRALAPGDAGLHYDNARLAMRYWHWGSPLMRKYWKESLQFVLQHGSQRFLGSVLMNRQEERLCKEPALRMPQTTKWCEGALYARGACFNPYRQPDVTLWCIQFGYPAEFLQ